MQNFKECKRSPLDKTGIGYKKEKEQRGTRRGKEAYKVEDSRMPMKESKFWKVEVEESKKIKKSQFKLNPNISMLLKEDREQYYENISALNIEKIQIVNRYKSQNKIKINEKNISPMEF